MRTFNETSTPDPRPPRGGWATGSYFVRCSKCEQYFMGDKRASECASCAYAGAGPAELNKALRAVELPEYVWRYVCSALRNDEQHARRRGKNVDVSRLSGRNLYQFRADALRYAISKIVEE